MDAMREYRPVNLPTRFDTVKMPVKLVTAAEGVGDTAEAADDA